MRRPAVAVSTLAIVAALSAPVALARGSHPGARRALGGRVATVDSTSKLAVLSLVGSKGKLVALDLRHASVWLTSKHGRVNAGTLASVRRQDRVAVTLKVSDKVAQADARAGISAPVARLLDQTPCDGGSSQANRNATIEGIATVVGGEQVTVSLGDHADGKSVTLDLTAAQVYTGRPPVASAVGSIVAGDRVLVNAGVSYETLKADIEAGTTVPAASLYDLGPRPVDSGGSEPTILGGAITAIGDGQLTISFGDPDHPHTAVLDISSASIYSGSHAATATPTTASALSVGDRVYAVLSVSEDVASADVHAGTPVPVSKVYDAGAVTSQPEPPSPPSHDGPAILGGTVASVGSGQITISFGDSGDSHTALLDISSASIYSGGHAATATPTTAVSLNVGDRVYAVLSVSWSAASADVQSGTAIAVTKLYDAGAGTS